MGFSNEAIHELRAALPSVFVAREGESLFGCELVVIDDHDADAMELMQWFTSNMPRFPILLWDHARRPPSDLADSCRDVLFPDRPLLT